MSLLAGARRWEGWVAPVLALAPQAVTMRGCSATAHADSGPSSSRATSAVASDRLWLQSVYEEARTYLEFLKVMAENTGGGAVLNTKEFPPGLDQIFSETAHYYLVGSQPAKPAADGRFRRLAGRGTRPGMTVGSPKGYYTVP